MSDDHEHDHEHRTKYIDVHKNDDNTISVGEPTDVPTDPQVLRDLNLAEIIRGVGVLFAANEIRISKIRNESDLTRWIELQFEMLSLKQDVIINALVEIMSADKEYQMALYSFEFQKRLSQHLDELFDEHGKD